MSASVASTPPCTLPRVLHEERPSYTREAMQQRIPGAELVVIDDAAHLSVVEQPAALTNGPRTGTYRVGT